MARSRWSIAFALVALAVTSPVVAAPLAAGPVAQKARPPGVDAEAEAEVHARRRLELEDLERQDAARELERRGVRVNWRDVPLAVLLDWCERMDAARVLASDHGVEVDWRNHTLAQLWELRLRASKAAEMASTFGVAVDWRRYSWADLEEMRRTLVRLRRTPVPEDALVGLERSPPGAAEWPHDPDSLLRPNFSARSVRRVSLRGQDPDGVLAPSFTIRYAQAPARRDPDGLLVPTFVPARARSAKAGRSAGDPDDVLDLSNL